jgi:energy-converting hydrogenase Eha subunit A
MNTDDIDLAYKIRRALNENLDNLPASTTDRLAAARAAALARKKATGAPAARPERQRWSFDVRALFAMPVLGRVAVIAPLVAMVAGLAGIYQAEHEQHVGELAELDAAVLSDDLPLTAYTDSGFNAYLVQQQQPQRAQ